jgi:hypothetical protein
LDNIKRLRRRHDRNPEHDADDRPERAPGPEIENGAALLIGKTDYVRSEKANTRAAYPALERLMIVGFRFSDIAEKIDRLYQQASNRQIPVVKLTDVS